VVFIGGGRDPRFRRMTGGVRPYDVGLERMKRRVMAGFGALARPEGAVDGSLAPNRSLGNPREYGV